MASEDDEIEFVNYKETDILVNEKDEKTLLQFVITVDEVQTVHKRNVYSLLDLLGDLGGLFGSLALLGQGLHWLISG